MGIFLLGIHLGAIEGNRRGGEKFRLFIELVSDLTFTGMVWGFYPRPLECCWVWDEGYGIPWIEDFPGCFHF